MSAPTPPPSFTPSSLPPLMPGIKSKGWTAFCVVVGVGFTLGLAYNVHKDDTRESESLDLLYHREKSRRQREAAAAVEAHGVKNEQAAASNQPKKHGWW